MNDYSIAFYFKTSALTGQGIHDMFAMIAQILDTLIPAPEFTVIQNTQDEPVTLI